MRIQNRLLQITATSVGLFVACSSSLFAQANSLGTAGGNTGRGTTGTGGTGGTSSLTGNPLNTGGPGATQLGDISNTINQGGFVGRSDNTGRFVGNTRASQQSTQTSRTFRGMQGGGNRNQGGSASRSTSVFRPVHRVAFTFSPRTNAKIRTSLQSRMTRLSTRSPKFNGLTLAMNPKGEVVLRGTVQSESTRNLAAAMVKLEPGVRSVKNEINVLPKK